MVDGFLYRFFHRIRQTLGIELGIGEYLLLMEALKKGYDANDTEAIYRLCKRLWLKSQDQEDIFFHLFQQEAKEEILLLQRRLQILNAQKKKETEQKQAESKSEVEIEKSSDKAEASQTDAKESNERIQTKEQESIQYETESVSLQFQDGKEGEEHLISRKFLFSPQYHPISEREMKQNLRFLRNKIPVGNSDKIHIPATVKQVAERAYFEDIVYQKKFVNKLQLLVFIDIGSSMLAFQELGKQLERSVLKGGGQANSSVFFFKEAPSEHIRLKRDGTQQLTLDELKQSIIPNYTNAIIFSDAGASLPEADRERLLNNWSFLDFVMPLVQHSVWLNPMPSNRWQNTPAALLSQVVPMVSCDKIGFSKAVKILRGKLTNLA